MKKMLILAITILLTMAQGANASSLATGDWCQNTYDDFNDVMTIDQNGNVKRATVGNDAGESFGFVTGTLFVGASNVSMELGGESVSIYNIGVNTHWLTGKKTLHIDYSDRTDEVFEACKIQWSKVQR